MRLLLPLTVALFLLPGCTLVPADAPRAVIAPSRLLIRTELYFGLSRPDGGSVSEDEWEEFLANVVTPRFPDGLTVLNARGQWMQQDGRIAREPTRILLLLHDATAEAGAAIDAIREEYKHRFVQEAVLRVDSRAAASF